MQIVEKNISSKDGFKVECQKCKCKKVSLQVDKSNYSDDTDDYYLICNHCGRKIFLHW